MSDLKHAIRQFVVDNFLFGQQDGLTDESSFLEHGILDSTGVLELVAHLEKTYALKIQDTEIVPDNLDSINGIASFLQHKQAVAVAVA